MGGRGSMSGSTNKFPSVQTRIDMKNLPELKGTQKQIEWANEIRSNIVQKLVGEMYTDKNGYRTDAPNYVFSQNSMNEWVNGTIKAFSDSGKKILQEKIEKSIENLTTAAVQMTRLRNLVSSETTARFWIDNRSTHPGDPTWKKLKKRVIGFE